MNIDFSVQELRAGASDASENIHQAQWAALESSSDIQEYCSSWLALLAMNGPGYKKLLLVGRDSGGSFKPLAFWPENFPPPDFLINVVEQAIAEKCGLVSDENLSEVNSFAVAYPVDVDGLLQFVVAAEVIAKDDSALVAGMEGLQWGSAWLEVLSRRQKTREIDSQLQRMSQAMDLMAQVLDEKSFSTASMKLVTALAHQMDCDRVSLGLKRGTRIKVEALSHSAQFGKRMNLIRLIGAAMDEAVLQGKNLVYPQPGDISDFLICREHKHLIQEFGASSILTVPLYGFDGYYGAITFERTGERSFSAEETFSSRGLVALACSSLMEKWQNDRPLLSKLWKSISGQLARLFGPSYLGRKLTAISLSALVVCALILEGDYRLSAGTVIEGSVQRMIVAPYNGYISETAGRAGDLVQSGDVLCRLDDRDLRLERLNLLSQSSQLEKQRQEALAKYDRAQVNILSAQIEQAKAQLELINSNLQRSYLKAPFNGLVTSGDLTQRLGGAVQQGEVLFEITPLDSYRVILKVDERRIADVQPGQTGELVLTSLPDSNFKYSVTKITPITTAEEGVNYFRVEANLTDLHQSLRPGMEGVGKTFIDRRNLFGILVRDLREWVTLWVWSWWP